jgi:hypothetical protein
MKPYVLQAAAALAAALMPIASLAAQAGTEPQASRSFRLTPEEVKWRRQSPEIPAMIGELWGNRDVDGGFGSMIRLQPGFDSGLHAHSGDFHGVVIKGTMIHEGPNGEGKSTLLVPGSYVRQAGGEMHIDRCVSKEPCDFLVVQFARADVIWPNTAEGAR